MRSILAAAWRFAKSLCLLLRCDFPIVHERCYLLVASFSLSPILQAMETVPTVDQPSSNDEASTSKPSKRDIPSSKYSKQCDLCHELKDVLVRCRIDEAQEWHFVCTGKCWRKVSGGVIDGPDKPFYQYGGMWKNKHAGVSAKKHKREDKKKDRVVSEQDIEFNE